MFSDAEEAEGKTRLTSARIAFAASEMALGSVTSQR